VVVGDVVVVVPTTFGNFRGIAVQLQPVGQDVVCLPASHEQFCP
jgi:hypothetical protein